jgi:hypothetical protein
MPRDPFIREKFTRERTAARKLAERYFRNFPKERYQTEVESWRHLQSQNIEFTMKRLREPIDNLSCFNRQGKRPQPGEAEAALRSYDEVPTGQDRHTKQMRQVQTSSYP